MRLILALMGLAVLPGNAQDPTPRQVAMRHLQETLSSQAEVKWVQGPTDPGREAQSTHVSASLTDVAVDDHACTVSFKDNRVFSDPTYRTASTWKLRLAEVEKVAVDSLVGFVERFRREAGQPGWGTKTDPAVFVLQIFAATNRKFATHRWSRNSANEVIERDQTQSPALIMFAEEAIARDAATAFEKAKELCSQ